jgi:uncharacterized membrane protein
MNAADVIIEYCALFFGYVGATLTIYGGLLALWRVIQREAFRKPLAYKDIRLDLTHKIVFALEFFIMADILSLLAAPSIDELTVLAVIVGIRTVLGYFLEREERTLESGIR